MSSVSAVARPVRSVDYGVGRIPELDGIRGLAISLVMLFHVIGVYALPGHLPKHPLASRLLSVGNIGASGVQLFFVLSGFLIGGILLDARNSPRYFATFYTRRALRIIPVYYTLLVVIAVVRRFVVVDGSLSLGWYFGFASNIAMALRSTWGIAVLGMCWSLGVEEQFYLTLPMAIRWLRARALVAVIICTIVAAPVLRFYLLKHGYQMASYMLMPADADCLGLGVLLAIVSRSNRIAAMLRGHTVLITCVSACALLSAVLYNSAIVHRPLTAALYGSFLAVGYAGLLYVAVLDPVSAVSGGMRSWPLRRIGVVAYGAYLFHQPCMAVAEHILASKSHLVVAFGRLLAVPVAVALATVSWKYFEKPLVRIGHRYSY